MGPVVITGGFGRVGRLVRPALLEAYPLRVVDRTPGDTLPGEDVLIGDLSEPGTAEEALAGASGLVHLAADPRTAADWEEVFRANVALTRRVLDAAAAHDVPRIVLASSVHAMGEYNRPEHRPVDPAWEPRPCCSYGLSKVIVETQGRLHAELTGASVVGLRLGATGYSLAEARYLGMWLSDRDAGALMLAALTAGPGWSVHFGMSANTRRHWDIASARKLGYAPRDDSEPYAATAGPPTVPICRMFAGPDAGSSG
ncbi:uronate dehydrogenase [Nonomuraea solani]|uniref:Uronate dehydrogenase n=1 Tax=Nonomuraea solani TaxID=1144553 RepID=A0A1H6EPQ2_9ACTN|nr:NAD(P)-dependent oxidoreductase [Nonomuraea solani]SEG99850.1 uronate dehydrogenase [Nonomuraea solani]